MPTKENGKKGININVLMEVEVVELIDAYAKTMRITRAVLVRNLLMSGLEDAKVLKTVGLLDMVGMIRALKESKKGMPELVLS